MTVTGSLTL